MTRRKQGRRAYVVQSFGLDSDGDRGETSSVIVGSLLFLLAEAVEHYFACLIFDLMMMMMYKRSRNRKSVLDFLQEKWDESARSFALRKELCLQSQFQLKRLRLT